MEKLIKLPFSGKRASVLHLDINSCFATLEQQANPFLRGRPVVVAAYATAAGCIVAPSIEAKRLGIKVGMKVIEARRLCPKVVVLTPDPAKYRTAHLRIKRLLEEYSPVVTPRSIDEFVLDLGTSPLLRIKGATEIATEIKQRIRDEVGDYISVSVGLAPNRFLAKTACGLKKPDGLEKIDGTNFAAVYRRLKLSDLCGIKTNNAVRLNSVGIYTVWDFFRADLATLKSAFESVVGYYWYLRLRGYEVDDVIFARKSYGNSYSLPMVLSSPDELAPILQKLTEKASFRMRRGGYCASGVHVGLLYRDHGFWHLGKKLPLTIYDSRDIYRWAYKLLSCAPCRKPVHTLSVACFGLERRSVQQLSLVENAVKKANLVRAVDEINECWGNFVITPARMVNTKNLVVDRIAFGGVKELEEIVLTGYN